MDFRVEITDPAIDDLAEIVSYIAQDNPDAASALGNHLLDAALSLAQIPHKGSPCRHIGNVRKLTVRPFKIFYPVTKPNSASRFCASGIPRDANQSFKLTSTLDGGL
jgi:toxin ParE1/3/4